MPLKLLCLGAYANGNLGDMYQADAIARLIGEIKQDYEVTSVSPSKRGSDYPAHHHQKGPVGGAFDSAFINSFDMLLVGGGGLLATKHAPLDNPEWVKSIKIPMAAISLGAAGGTPSLSADFIKKCTYFSVRDEYSYEAVRGVRPNVHIVMDPILVDEISKPAISTRSNGIIWVPGKLVQSTRTFWEDVQRRLQREGDPIVSFNPVTDINSGFEETFDGVRYLDSVSHYLDIIAESNFVVSERYHGCIFALARGKPTIGLTPRDEQASSKVRELYRRAGSPRAAVSGLEGHTRSTLRGIADSLDLDKMRTFFMAERKKFLDFLKGCLC